MFVLAADTMAPLLAAYARRATRSVMARIRRFINENHRTIAPRKVNPATLRLRSRGRVYDLHRLAAEVNRDHFAGRLELYVTWAQERAPRRRVRRHIQFGSYDHGPRLVRINPLLDDENVPEYFVKFVIYHEMLHADLDPEHDADGRRCVHTREFRDREKQHPDYERAIAWEKNFFRLNPPGR